MIAAMKVRVIHNKLEPYGDFSLFTPFGRRMAKILSHRSWVPQEDGTYRAVDSPTWTACFKVYTAVLYMLRFKKGSIKIPVVRPTFTQLVHEHPEAWHVLVEAEDRTRAEFFPRIRRRLRCEPDASWDDAFLAASQEDRFWDKDVHRPALAFIARGGQWQTSNIQAKLKARVKTGDNGSSSSAKRKAIVKQTAGPVANRK
eukprot:1476815-Amphidinium_carterae.1